MASYDDTATVSGSVVSFPNGADDVPTKSCEVALSPSLDGYAEVDVVQNGKNLVNIPDSAEITRNQLNSTIVPLLDDFLNGKKGNFTISAKTAETVENANFITIRINYTDSTSSSNVYIYRGSTHESGEITGTFSISSDPTKTIDSVSFGGNTGTAKCAVSEWQIEANSQATTYEPFTAPTTHTANLGRTIYGGTADIVNGTGIAGWALHKVTSSDGIYDYATGSGFRVSTSTWAEGIMKAESNNGGICNEFDTVTNNTNRGVRFSIGDNTSIYFVQVYSEIGNTVEAFKTWLDNHDVYVVYPIATPTDFTFTGQEINTRLGYNAFWSEQGDTELTYYKSGYGFTSVTVHKETPEGEPVAQTVKFHRIVYGGQADVVKGTCEPKNLFDLGTSPSDYEDASKISSVSGNIVSMTIIGSGSTYTYRKQDITIKGVVTLSMKSSVHYSRFLVKFRSADNTRWLTNSDVTISETGWTYNQYYNGWFIQTTDTTVVRTITIPDCLYWRLGIGYASNAADIGSVETLSEIMLEKGSSASDFAPHFDPFTFPPISMSTDEGENTLFANECDSAITYRKAVD